MNLSLPAALAALFVINLSFGIDTALSQDVPLKIPQFAQDCRSHEWYVRQVKLWRGVVTREPQNADAWYQLYKAQRYSFFGDTTLDKQEKIRKTNDLMEEMGKYIPESTEYNLAMYRAGGADISRFSYLEKAYKSNPQYPELFEELVVYYELTGDIDKRNYFLKQLYDGHSFAPALFDFGYNILMSVEKNGILIVCGDNDTYPLWMLQTVKGIRNDVTVMNISLIGEENYRPMFLKRNGIAANETALSEEYQTKNGYLPSVQKFIASLAAKNPAKPLYIALTVDPDYTDSIKDDLYITGLAYKYSPKRFDNVAVLKNNWNNFRLDYLSMQFYTENLGFTTTRQPLIDINYVAPAMILYEHYSLAGETEKAGELSNLALSLGKSAGQESDVESYLKQSDAERSPSAPQLLPSLGENDIQISPNPAMNSLNVKLPDGLSATITITDVRGNIVATLKAEQSEQTFPISAFASGSYTVQFFTSRGVVAKILQIIR